MQRRKTPIPFPDTGKQIRYYHQLRGYSTNDLAQLINIDSKYLSSLESGHQMPSLKILYRLSVVLNVPIEALIMENHDKVIGSDDFRARLIQDLTRYSDDELEILHRLMCDIIPRMRKFKEY